MNHVQAIPVSERIGKRGGDDVSYVSSNRHRINNSNSNNNMNDNAGGFLSLDLPEETWEGEPCAEIVSVAASRKTSATKQTTVTASVACHIKEGNLVMSRKERAFVESLQRQWESEDNPPMSVFMYLQFARFSNFYAKEAIKAMKEIDPMYMKLTMKKMEMVIHSQTLFPLPGLTSKNGYEVAYMRPSKFFPRKTSTKYILANLAYVLLTMAEREGPSSYGVCFVADMTDWTMENYSSEYWAELMKMLQGGVPVKVNQFLIVNPPGWFGTIMKVNKSLFSPTFARKVKTIQDKELSQYLARGFEEFLPAGFGGGRANRDDIVENFITTRLSLERKVKRKQSK